MAESQNLPLDVETGLFRYIRRSFFEAGQDSVTVAPAQDADDFESLENVSPASTSGTLERRWGYTSKNAATGLVARLVYEYQRDSDGTRRILGTAANGTGVSSANNKVVAFNEDGTIYNASVMVPAAGASNPHVVASRDYAYISDGLVGDAKKWDGSAAGGLTKWGITAPVTAISVGAPVAGAVTLKAGRKYYVVFSNTNTVHNSGLSPVSASTGAVTAKNIPLSNIEVSGDAQVNNKWVLATADGGDETKLYRLVQLANATTTFTDNVDEGSLLLREVYLETDEFGIEHGVADNTPPPAMTNVIKHQGRLVGVTGQSLRFSKSLDELLTSTGTITGRYEECWPADFELDISEGAETVKALISDGGTLWIGTERHIRRMLGDSPLNFQNPQVAFNEVGVLNQETWKAIFLEGTPIGVMWLTPDLKVIGSDFNSYSDVGAPIQNILDSINDAAKLKCSASYVGYGADNFYMLAVPTGSNTECDTICVYDLKVRKWYIWKPTDKTTAQLFNIPASGKPQLLFWTDLSTLHKWDANLTQDRVAATPVSFTVRAKTTWLDFGDPAARKALNEIEVIGDTALTVMVEGASTAAEFATPSVVQVASPVSVSPLGELKVYLAGATSKDRFYRFTFEATGSNIAFLGTLNIEAVALHRI